MKPIWLAAAVLLAPVAVAQQPKPCTGPGHADFDFWVGEWSVADPKGAKQGDNSVKKEEGGCLIVERWTSLNGGTGQSYNFLDPGTLQWRQVWVSAGNVIDYAGGLNAKGQMELAGRISYRDGRSAPFRGLWTPNADGTVTQHFEEFDREKKAWTVWFTGTYTRKK